MWSHMNGTRTPTSNLGSPVELQKKLMVIRDGDLIQCPLFPDYKDVAYEICPQESVAEYLVSLAEGGN